MFPGLFTLCLNVTDLAGMRHFYEALGFQTHIDQPQSVVLNNGDVDIALMTFLDEPCLNFRGADPFSMHKLMTDKGLKLEGEPEEYTQEQYDADADGRNWMTKDPDGNNVFFDTNEGEIGQQGAGLALQRVLDATSKQLINVGASRACQNAFRAKVLEKFMPMENRASTGHGLDTSPLTESGKFAGHFTLCLKTTDNTASRTFYEAMGLEVTGNNDEHWVQMGNGDVQLALMSFLETNMLNFRGVDPFAIYDVTRAAGLVADGEPTRYTEEDFGVPGAHWQTHDPDGNVVYFDTSDPELIAPGDAEILKHVLEKAHRQLRNIRADEACIDAFQTEILATFT